jgi:hypothetical protein
MIIIKNKIKKIKIKTQEKHEQILRHMLVNLVTQKCAKY